MTAKHLLAQIVRGLDGVTEGDASPAQNYNCPCAHPSQCDNSCFSMVFLERLSIRAGGSDDTAYAFTEADDEGDYVTYNDAKRAISVAEARATAAEATVIALQEKLRVAEEALEYYANPEIYKPHPHGSHHHTEDGEMNKEITEAMLKAARDAFREMCGITIYLPGEGDLDDFERARFEALEAVIAVALDMAPAQPVAIKPLEWVDESEGLERHRASPPVGPVYTVEDDGFSAKKYHVNAHQLVIGNFDGLEEAKAAAQSDFEARIRSALSVPLPEIEGGDATSDKMVGGDTAALIKQAVGECLAGMIYSEVSKDARRKIERAIDMVSAPKPAWRDMASAPKDGTMLRLLIVPDQDEFTAFDDSLTPYETIGSNNLTDTGDDRWEFAGWDWQQDCFITGRGEVIGWAPFRAAEVSQIEAAVRWCLDRDQRNGSLPEAYAERLRAALPAAPSASIEGEKP